MRSATQPTQTVDCDAPDPDLVPVFNTMYGEWCARLQWEPEDGPELDPPEPFQLGRTRGQTQQMLTRIVCCVCQKDTNEHASRWYVTCEKCRSRCGLRCSGLREHRIPPSKLAGNKNERLVYEGLEWFCKNCEP